MDVLEKKKLDTHGRGFYLCRTGDIGASYGHTILHVQGNKKLGVIVKRSIKGNELDFIKIGSRSGRIQL